MTDHCRLWPWIACTTKVVTGVVILIALVIAATWVILTLALVASGVY
jgi:hypothetical protein